MKRIKKLSPMQELMNRMSIDETYTKPIKYKFPKVKDNIFPKSGYNYQADILEMGSVIVQRLASVTITHYP